MIEVSELRKAYGPIQALDGVSFRVETGEVVALLGPNGAGKSTAIRILTGYLQPDEGTVRIDGLDVLTHRLEVQARIGYLPENAPLYPELSVQDYLEFVAELRGIPQEERLERIAEAVYATGAGGPAHPTDRPVEQRLPPAGRLGSSHSPPSQAADPGRADRRLGPDADSRDSSVDPPAGSAEHGPFFDSYPPGGGGRLRSGDHSDEREGPGRPRT
ncbi:MAG: hypothetical protein KatS3mg115_2056 [Candidatus Poribacteria bacterium]|nr:MAG: hypothetical protein KatS3mg115_2056 [Candidatus Poribacteria bacterium]